MTDPSTDTIELSLDGPDPRSGVVPARYALREHLSSGGQGAVYLAFDRVAEREVVVKLVALDGAMVVSRFGREAAVLRQLAVPGVVALVDAGVARGWGFLVMERVPGTAFPAGRTTWAALEPTVVALLDTLARVHDRGVVHRDLKPGNVLVDEAGTPVLLDFGLVLPGDSTTVTRTGTVMGTPRYMAPEQLRGERGEPRTDLYALGVMIWEALVGDVPFGSAGVAGLQRLRLERDTPPLLSVCPDVPPRAAALVDTLLARRPSQRPGSARRALRLLRPDGGVGAYRWLGSRAAIDAVVTALLDGRRVSIGGPRGAGRTRLLREAEAELLRHGRTVAWVPEATAPLGSLRPIVGDPEPGERSAVDTLRERLCAALAGGLVLFVDAPATVDGWSAKVLATVPGPVAQVGGAAGVVVAPPTLDEAALRTLVAGPERLLHLPSDTARLLFRRTGGVAARVAAEVDRWVGSHLAEWDGELLRVTREALSQLEGGLAGVPIEEFEADGLPAPLDDLLAWVHLAGPGCTVERLARARGEPRWELELSLAALEERGGVALADGAVEPLRPAWAMQRWETEVRLAAHGALAAALPEGAAGRLPHLLAAGDTDAVVTESLVAADRAVAEGRTSDARTALRHAVLAAVAVERPSPELWRRLLSIAVHEFTWPALADAEDLLGRAQAPWPYRELVSAAVALVHGRRDEAEATLADVPALADALLEQVRWELVLQVGAPDAVDAAVAWASRVGTLEALAAQAAWVSRWHYQAGRPREAADEAEAGITIPQPVAHRVRLLLRALVCRLELAEVDRVRALAAELRRLGAESRLPVTEAWGEWGERVCLRRLREPVGVDADLVDAVEHIGSPQLVGHICITEALVAWRAGDVATTVRLAGRAESAFREASQPEAAAWARAVRVGVARVDAEVADACRELVETDRDDIVGEGLAFLAATVGIPPVYVLRSRDALARLGPGLDRTWPRGAMTVEEMWAAVATPEDERS